MLDPVQLNINYSKAKGWCKVTAPTERCRNQPLEENLSLGDLPYPRPPFHGWGGLESGTRVPAFEVDDATAASRERNGVGAGEQFAVCYRTSRPIWDLGAEATHK